MRARPMSRRSSNKSFKKNLRRRAVNNYRGTPRGGIRL